MGASAYSEGSLLMSFRPWDNWLSTGSCLFFTPGSVVFSFLRFPIWIIPGNNCWGLIIFGDAVIFFFWRLVPNCLNFGCFDFGIGHDWSLAFRLGIVRTFLLPSPAVR